MVAFTAFSRRVSIFWFRAWLVGWRACASLSERLPLEGGGTDLRTIKSMYVWHGPSRRSDQQKPIFRARASEEEGRRRGGELLRSTSITHHHHHRLQVTHHHATRRLVVIERRPADGSRHRSSFVHVRLHACCGCVSIHDPWLHS